MSLQTGSQLKTRGVSQHSCAYRQHTIAGGEHGACRRSRGTLQRKNIDPTSYKTAHPIVFDVFRSPGQPLDSATRAYMEPHFGHDFSRVRIHTDTKAAESARAVNALAYTAGKSIVFDIGQYAPATSTGRRLIAHELAHVVQQKRTSHIQTNLELEPTNAPHEQEANRIADSVIAGRQAAFSRFDAVAPRIQRACREEIGSVGDCIGVGGQDITDVGSSSSSDNLFRFVVGCDRFRPGEEERLRREFSRSIAMNEPVEVHGFASEDGDETFNEHLSCARAHAAEAILQQESLSGRIVKFKHGPTPGEPEDRRSVVIAIQSAETSVPTNPCALPALPNPAVNLTQYVQLVQCIERAFPTYSPRQNLSLLRQLYYGNRSWSRTRSRHWERVIPCGLSIPDPRTSLGSDLFNTLHRSQVVAGVDMGHVFTGLESMVCPSATVELEVTGPNPVVNMPNEEFATWGGDLGSAAAYKTHDEVDRRILRPWSRYFDTSGTPASSEDLEGDIDSFVIRKGLSGATCGSTSRTRLPTLTSPISQILREYYSSASSPVGTTRSNYIRCFVQAIGGTMSGRQITNKSALITPIRNRVQSFAETFYLSLVTIPLFAIGVREAMKLLQYSWEVTQRFLDWLEQRL